MKLSKSFIGLVTVSTIFILYSSGLYTNFQSDSALEIVDFSIAKPASEKNIPSNPDRVPLYGDLHVHTKYSFDAYIFGVTATPYDAYKYAINKFDDMKGRAYNVGLDDANLSKIELAEKIKEHLPNFVFLEAPIGEDPDKRDYIVSNARLAKTGFKTEWDLDRGIKELIKGYQMIRNSIHSNI